MLSYTQRRSLAGTLSNNSSTTALAAFDILISEKEKQILSSRAWTFLEKQFTVLTDSANQFVTLPQYIDRVSSVYITVGSYNYTPRECPSREQWDRLNMTTVSSDIPQWWYVYDGKLGLFPKASTTGNTITVNSKRLAKDLTIADYTAGNVLTTVVGSATVTGTGTTWAASMAGRYLRITESDTTNKGDGFWYEILSVASTTSLTLKRVYAGTAITAGAAAYSISQTSLIPEQYQQLPIMGALEDYFISIDPNQGKAKMWGDKYKELFAGMEADYTVKNSNCVIDDGLGKDFALQNPNLYISL